VPGEVATVPGPAPLPAADPAWSTAVPLAPHSAGRPGRLAAGAV